MAIRALVEGVRFIAIEKGPGNKIDDVAKATYAMQGSQAVSLRVGVVVRKAVEVEHQGVVGRVIARLLGEVQISKERCFLVMREHNIVILNAISFLASFNQLKRGDGGGGGGSKWHRQF